ncbi:MAG TPA: TetR/AcrR family transcriptional regulator, partial [Acidimicrobiales bacterium]
MLDTAADLLATDGAGAITMEGVAARAGVSKGLGYRYFTNAEDLLVALYDREIATLGERVTAAIAGEPTFEGVVRASLTVWLDALSERGAVIGNLTRAGAVPGPVEQRSREVHAAVSEFFGERASAAFELTPRMATAAASVLLSGLDGLVNCWLERGMPR